MSASTARVTPAGSVTAPGQGRRPAVSAAVLAVISVGGAIGASARYGLALAWPHRADAFPWATFSTNVIGCLLLGALMVVVTETTVAHPLLRPFLGVGVLGGFTTFSTYAVDAQLMVSAGAARTGLLYLAATPVAALAGVALGVTGARLVAARPRPGRA